jgi:2,3-bisphosphoglycerate-dependent phosphoglycerate mutase
MNRIFLFGLMAITFTSCSHSYYIVRHAEKATQEANMSSDVPLTPEGEHRAQIISSMLHDKKIAYVFSTNTIRTRSTAKPTADLFHLTTEIYGPRPDSTFIRLLRSRKKNTLVVAHSNTVDDIVNMLIGEKKLDDLPDSEYSKMFIVKMKGKKADFSEVTIPSGVKVSGVPKF